jgi:hypothetical protein
MWEFLKLMAVLTDVLNTPTKMPKSVDHPAHQQSAQRN